MTVSPINPPLVLRSERNRAAVIGALRALLPRAEGTGGKVMPFGIAAIDARLPQGGIALATLHEIAPLVEADWAAALGFTLALLGRLPADPPQGAGPIFVVETSGSRGRPGPFGGGEAGSALSGHGLAGLGLDPARLILVQAGDDHLALWAAEEALRSAVPAAVAAGLVGEIDLKASQRLQLAAAAAGIPLLLLRPAGRAGASLAVTRWRIAGAPAGRDPFGLAETWRWKVRLERCRNGRPGEWLMEFDHAACRFRLVAALADPEMADRPAEGGVPPARSVPGSP